MRNRGIVVWLKNRLETNKVERVGIDSSLESVMISRILKQGTLAADIEEQLRKGGATDQVVLAIVESLIETGAVFEEKIVLENGVAVAKSEIQKNRENESKRIEMNERVASLAEQLAEALEDTNAYPYGCEHNSIRSLLDKTDHYRYEAWIRPKINEFDGRDWPTLADALRMVPHIIGEVELERRSGPYLPGDDAPKKSTPHSGFIREFLKLAATYIEVRYLDAPTGLRITDTLMLTAFQAVCPQLAAQSENQGVSTDHIRTIRESIRRSGRLDSFT